MATCNQIKSDTMGSDAYFVEGQKFKGIQIRIGNANPEIFSEAGFKENDIKRKPISVNEYYQSCERILKFYEEEGFPFASVKLDSIQFDTVNVTASFNINQGRFISFDTLHVVGNAKIKKWYLQRYLGITPTMPYQENLISGINNRINQLPFLSANRKAGVYFYGNKAIPFLYIDTRKSSSFDGIIGFAPNSQNNNNTLLVTGEANIKFQNLFESGKSFELNYRSFLGNSQDLKIKFVFPYIFRSKIGFDYNLSFLKQDTTYLDVRHEFGLQYRFIGTDYIRFFYQIQTTSLITVDTNKLKLSGTLPDANDLINSQYGIAMRFTRLDYLQNPRKGYFIELSGSIGNKQIIKNQTIESVESNAYDGVKLITTQYKFNLNSDNYIQLSKYTTLRAQLMGGYLQSPRLFLNELFRIGGIRTLKGFDEQSIFADRYLIANTEFRYLLQQNSNFLLFWNGAYYKNNVRIPAISDKPYGFGAGLNIESKAGVFSLYYALGKAFNNPIEVSKAKVHFGYVNYF